jgi:ABC-type hemin transport system ATPase subunit
MLSHHLQAKSSHLQMNQQATNQQATNQQATNQQVMNQVTTMVFQDLKLYLQ